MYTARALTHLVTDCIINAQQSLDSAASLRQTTRVPIHVAVPISGLPVRIFSISCEQSPLASCFGSAHLHATQHPHATQRPSQALASLVTTNVEHTTSIR